MNALRHTPGIIAVSFVAVGSSLAFSMPDSQCSTIKLIASEKSNRWESMRGEEISSSNRPGAPFQRQRWRMTGDVEPFEKCYISDKTYRGGAPIRSVSCIFKIPTVPDKSVMTDELREKLLTTTTEFAKAFAQCLGSKPRESADVNDSGTSHSMGWEWELSPPGVRQAVKVSLGAWIPKVGVVVDGVRTYASLLASFD